MKHKKPDYPEEYRGILKFSDFKETLSTLSALQELLLEARTSGDKKKLKDLKSLAAVGEKRARGIAANPKVQPGVAKEKGEIARWFSVWRENPGIFFSWVQLRIRSREFLADFGEQTGESVRADLSALGVPTPGPKA